MSIKQTFPDCLPPRVFQYLASVQDDVAAVLIAKRTVLRATTAAEAINMRSNLDERIKDIASRFGPPMAKSKMHRFPKELSLLSEHLFHLRRGPLLGRVVSHEDERLVYRNLFLNVSFDLSLRMVAPRFLMHREGGTFKELPAYDLTMQSDSAIVLDHGTDIFIWLGAELAADKARCAAALAACRTLAEELTEIRFSCSSDISIQGIANLRCVQSFGLTTGRQLSRSLSSFTPPYEQEAKFPQLRSLTVDQRTKLKSSFIHLDDPSFLEWMQSLKVGAPELS